MPRMLVILLLALLAAACARDEPNEDDAATVKAMLRSDAELSRSLQPLFSCLPEDADCYRQAGPAIVETTERERAGFDRVLAETDDACLKEAASLYSQTLAVYGDAGRAATEGNTRAADAAISKTTELEIAFTEKIGECGFSEGRMAEQSAAGREVSIGLLRLSEEIAACPDDACVLQAIPRGKALATEGITLVDRSLAELAQEEGEMAACMQEMFRVSREMFQAVRSAFTAIENSKFAMAEREATRAGELRIQADEDLAACMSSAGL